MRNSNFQSNIGKGIPFRQQEDFYLKHHNGVPKFDGNLKSAHIFTIETPNFRSICLII